MKNLDTNNLTKVDLVRGIIRLTNTTNNLLRSCGNNLEHGCLAESTLRTKSREFLEKQFEQAWGWLYKEVRANYGALPINIDRRALDAIKARSEKAIEENFNEYLTHLNMGDTKITELIHNHIINEGMLDVFPDIKIDDVIVIPLSGRQVRVGLKGCVDRAINYYHTEVDSVDMVGTFDLDSERGRQQLFLMSLLSHIGCNNELRAKINEILEDIHDKNLTLVRMNKDIQHSMTQDIDAILLPYINGVATGEFE